MISLAALFLSKQVDFTDPQNLFTLRVLYGLSTVIQVVAGVICYFKILQKNDGTEIVVPAPPPGTGFRSFTVFFNFSLPFIRQATSHRRLRTLT